MNIDAADAIALIGLLQHDTLGSNTLSVAGFTEDNIRVVILSGDAFRENGVSAYRITSCLPEEFEKQLPSVEDLQKRIL